MSILIIALPRTGSSVLMEALGRALSMHVINEPFNTVAKKDFRVPLSSITPDSNVIVKSIIGSLPYNDKLQEELGYKINPKASEIENSLSWHLNLSKRFKHVILLDRHDMYDQCISFTNAEKTNIWHNTYKAEIDEESIQNCISWLSECKAALEIISVKLNVPITFYENYFSDNLKVRVNEINNVARDFIDGDRDIYIKYTDPSRRYRKQRNTSKLL